VSGPEAIFVSTLNQHLRDRVAEAVECFNEAFSAAEKDDTPQNLGDLADTADRVMRAVGRVLIEAKRQLGDDGLE
jgi:hypothetical protein